MENASTSAAQRQAALALSIIVPTFNESQNVQELIRRVREALAGEEWEMIFVDDDSPDGTADVVRGVARLDPRIRCIQRIGRRGLSSACVEGMLASAAPLIAVMDADLQHDETILPKMVALLKQDSADVVVGTRYTGGGSTGDWDKTREAMSRLATSAARLVIRQDVSDPMSGFFMLRRGVLDQAVRNLSMIGFKILLDLLASGPVVRVKEVPYQFRSRFAGESKLDEMIVLEYGMLLVDKTIGRYIPVRFFTFALVGGLGVVVHMSVLTLVLRGLQQGFTLAQSLATVTAMIFNFGVNNVLTYRDRRLRGRKWVKGLLSFMAACSVGALANVGIASYLFANRTQWFLAALAGVLVSAVWNYAITQIYTWGK